MKGSFLRQTGLLVGLLLLVAGQVYGADPDTLYVRHIEGTVELAEAGSSQWMEAAVNTPLVAGDTIRTAALGKAELFLKDGSVVRVGRSSVMRIVAVEPKGVQFKLDRGGVYIVARGSKDVPIFFDTPSAVLDVAQPATVRVDVYDGGVSEVSVYQGEVQALEQKGRMPVRAGERLVLAADGSIPRVMGLRSADEWQRWNTERDRATFAAVSTGESTAYLPEELRTYSSDLDANGQWVYTPEYGYAWAPTVITVSTWSPYRFGRWVWIGGSYVWVGYEPWGWAPYHYGRWVHHRHAGWCWVPPARGHVRWEPAHVAWVHSSRHVGWVPLAPGETYDRRRAPVIHQTNNYTIYNNVTLERSVSTARTTYANAGVRDAVVSVERDSMLRAKTVRVNVEKTGTVPLRKVSLPAGVVPARAKSEPVRTIDRPKTEAGMPGQPRTSAAPTRGGGVPSASTQKTSAVPQPAPVVGQRSAAAPSLATRIEGAGKRGTQPGTGASARQPGVSVPAAEKKTPEDRRDGGPWGKATGGSVPTPVVRGTTGNNTVSPVNARPLAERIGVGRSSSVSGTPQPVPAAPSAVRPDSTFPGRVIPQASAPVADRAAARPAAVTAPPQNAERAAQAGRTAERSPTMAVSGSQNTPIVRVPENRQPAAPRNAPTRSVSAPVQARPAAVTAPAAQSIQRPAQPVVRAQQAPRQAAPRVEQRPAAVQKEKAEPQAARQSPAKEKAAPPAAAPDKSEASKPVPASGGSGLKAQQSAPAKQARN
ncbi:MAG: hypothetical protein GXX82_15565 [Syntrophorhabdus sp.]|nr:hypothetical protein [Syntrophorhabdus sp.]